MNTSLLETGLLLFALTFVGGVLPLVRRWSERGLHVFAALSAGVFLGLVFLHLLPELGQSAAAGVGKLPWLSTLAGFLALFFAEKVWLEGRAASDRHRTVWYATYFGLLLHTAATGFGLAAVFDETHALGLLLVATAAHKATESFSLATVMRLAGLPARRSLALLAAHALVAPLFLVLGRTFAPAHAPSMTGLACGTFLYVATCDLLPEVFHGEDPRWLKIAYVLAGVAAAGGIELLPGH